MWTATPTYYCSCTRTSCEQPLLPTTVHALQPPVNGHSHLLLVMRQNLLPLPPTAVHAPDRTSCEQPLPRTVNSHSHLSILMYQNLPWMATFIERQWPLLLNDTWHATLFFLRRETLLLNKWLFVRRTHIGHQYVLLIFYYTEADRCQRFTDFSMICSKKL